MAVFMNIARRVGAGPLMVIDTLLFGAHRSKPEYSTFMSSSVAMRHAGVADLAVDVGPQIGLEAVQRHRVERGGQPLGRHVLGQQMKALVGAERVAFAGEHARRILVLALEREHATGDRGTSPEHSPA